MEIISAILSMENPLLTLYSVLAVMSTVGLVIVLWYNRREQKKRARQDKRIIVASDIKQGRYKAGFA